VQGRPKLRANFRAALVGIFSKSVGSKVSQVGPALYNFRSKHPEGGAQRAAESHARLCRLLRPGRRPGLVTVGLGSKQVELTDRRAGLLEADRSAAQVRKTPCRPLAPPYSLHTASIEPTKDKSRCSIKVASEKDAVSAQTLGRRQPFIAGFSLECAGRRAYLGLLNTLQARDASRRALRLMRLPPERAASSALRGPPPIPPAGSASRGRVCH
jgi:hypothetical protein